LAFYLLVLSCEGHGTLVWPPSNRVGGKMEHAGDCVNYECMWFSHPCVIPGEPTLDPMFRTFNLGVNDGPLDWSRKMPWRAPGSAPVKGSGCGLAGGNSVRLFNGGFAPPGYAQGADGLTLPEQKPQVWKRGAIEEVAWGLTVNHGGGYSYRLCKRSATGEVDEACFQKNSLRFAGDKQWLQYGQFSPTRPRYEIPLFKTSNGTSPVGSEWARLPVPACKICDTLTMCGQEMSPNMTDASGKLPTGETFYGGQKWIDQIECSSLCTGATPVPEHAPPPTNNDTEYGLSDGLLCPPGETEYEEVLPGVSGFLANHSFPERSIVGFSIVDKIIVPDLEDGTYLLSWRWDCESTYQVWENCADIQILGSASQPPSPSAPQPLSPSAPQSPPPPNADSWRLYFIIAVSALGLVSEVSAIAFLRHSCSKSTPLLREPLVRSSIQKA